MCVMNSIGMKLKLIPAGEFAMGLPKSHKGIYSNSKPRHRVRITQPFYLGVTVVTEDQWESVMGTKPWKGKPYVKKWFKKGAHYPATYVSWEDAVEFCEQLSAKEGVTYRLPTEAEWEYACRAGTTSLYHFGNNRDSRLGDYAWFQDDPLYDGQQYAHKIGQKKPNPFGLYDMYGNVREWCADWYDEGYYGVSPESDPKGPSEGSLRVFRGGCFFLSASCCDSASRNSNLPSERNESTGFRVARSPAGQ